MKKGLVFPLNKCYAGNVLKKMRPLVGGPQYPGMPTFFPGPPGESCKEQL